MSNLANIGHEGLPAEALMSGLQELTLITASMQILRAQCLSETKAALADRGFSGSELSIIITASLLQDEEYRALNINRNGLRQRLAEQNAGHRLLVVPLGQGDPIVEYVWANPHMDFDRDKEMGNRTAWNVIGKPVVASLTNVFLSGNLRMEKKGLRVLKWMDLIHPIKVTPYDSEGNPQVGISYA